VFVLPFLAGVVCGVWCGVWCVVWKRQNCAPSPTGAGTDWATLVGGLNPLAGSSSSPVVSLLFACLSVLNRSIAAVLTTLLWARLVAPSCIPSSTFDPGPEVDVLPPSTFFVPDVCVYQTMFKHAVLLSLRPDSNNRKRRRKRKRKTHEGKPMTRQRQEENETKESGKRTCVAG
jgi:hypothetical protein